LAILSNRLPHALLGGFAGAAALTVLHETARRLTARAPRMDILGRRALARGLESIGVEPPPRDQLQAMALVGDVATNGLMYTLVGVGSPESAHLRGALIGAAAGLGAVVLPPRLGLGHGPEGLSAETKAMTFAWYLFGGIVAAEVYRRLA
jgi:prepilin signal peptidase PulO-like enzyme (type II secretory pathway)